jgi:hypothetical protein
MDRDYTAEQALELLLRKLTERAPELASQVRTAVNAGKDIIAQERNKGSKKARSYRRKVPYSPEEALEISLSVLESYFIEQPLLWDSALRNFNSRAGETVMPGQNASTVDLQIELQPETELVRGTGLAPNQTETESLHSRPHEEIQRQRMNVEGIRALIDFSEKSSNGYVERS